MNQRHSQTFNSFDDKNGKCPMLNQKYMGLRTKDLIGADQRSDNNKIGYTTKSALCNTRFRIPPCPIFLGVLPRLHRELNASSY